MELHILERNNVHVNGAGEQTIVFAHGFGCDQSVWKKIVPAFEADYRVVLFDYVGSGRSDKTAYSRDRYNSLYGYAQDVLDVCDALDLENIIFVGHSVSGMIGALAAIKRPELIDKLIMIGSSPHYLNEPDYYGGFEKADIDELLDMMETNFMEWSKYLAPIAMQSEEHIGEFAALLRANDQIIARQFAEVTFYSDHRDEVPKIPVCTLLLETSSDAIAPPDVGQYLHKHIPRNDLVTMKMAKGHNPHISEPEETIKEIRRFIEGKGAAFDG